MCTYSISVDDELLEQVRPAFADNAEINSWMQSQIEALLLQMAAKVSVAHSGSGFPSVSVALLLLLRRTSTTNENSKSGIDG